MFPTTSRGIQQPNPLHLTCQRLVAQIDALVEETVNRILQHPAFKALERRWRSLAYLLDQVTQPQRVKVKVLDVQWPEIVRDQARALEFDQSQLFFKIYNQAFGTAGGEPFGVIIGDYAVSHRMNAEHGTDDLPAMTGLAQIGAQAFAPVILAAEPAFFGLDDFSNLSPQVDIEAIFKAKEYEPWHQLRRNEAARFLGLVVPQMLLRQPYASAKGFVFRERQATCSSSSGIGSPYLWGHAGMAFAAVLIREFTSVGWFSQIQGVARDREGGGLVIPPVVLHSQLDATNQWHKPQTSLVLTEGQDRQLAHQGFMALSQCFGQPVCAFYHAVSCFRSQDNASKELNDNARLAGLLQNVLCASRFAHYIKILTRDKLGSYVSVADCEYALQSWIHQYTSSSDHLDWETQARYPLREASIQVKAIPEKPGHYVSFIRLKPQYMANQLSAQLCLVTELSSPQTIT